MSSSTTAAYPPVATGSAPGVATTIAGRVVDSRQHTVSRGRRAHQDPGQGTAQLLGGAGVAEHRSAQAVTAALGTSPAGRDGRAPGALRWALRAAQAERPVADAAQGRRAASVAGEPGRVADARCLHEHRSGLHGISQQRVRLGRHPGRPSARVAFEVVVSVTGEVHRDALAHDVPRRHDLCGPTRAEEVLRLHTAGVRRQHGRAAGLLGAHEQNLAGMGVRRARLVVQVVTVVPDRHQSEVLHRREHGGAGADHDAHRPAADRQKRAVALRPGRCLPPAPRGDPPQPFGERSVETSHVAVVGNADEGAPAGRSRRHHGLGENLGPVVAGKHRPHGPGRLPSREPLQHGQTVGISRELLGTGRRGDQGRRLGGLLLDGCVPGRDGQPEDIGADAGVPRGHSAGQRGDVGAEHRARG